MRQQGIGYGSDAEALVYAGDMRARTLINCSWGAIVDPVDLDPARCRRAGRRVRRCA